MDRKEKAAWEIRNEKNKAGVRWLLIFIIVPYLSYLLLTGKSIEIGHQNFFNWFYVLTVAAFVNFVQLLTSVIIQE